MEDHSSSSVTTPFSNMNAGDFVYQLDDEVGDVPVTKIRRKPIPRKGHTKSRRGCFNCKRRRVKCPETLPHCDSCVRLGLVCEYPPTSTTVNAVARGPSHTPSSSLMAPSNSLSSSPAQFSLEDLRFFHHFLFTAYPPLPIGGKAVWRDMAALSHNFDYLIHAVLGLGASHLTLSSHKRNDFSPQALYHRVQAINSLNAALSRPCSSTAEGDARFATLMALTFQSSYMVDGMTDFLAMVRGCTLIPAAGMPSLADSAFRSFNTEEHQQSVRELNETGWGVYDEPLKEFSKAGLKSLHTLRPLCLEGSLERNYLDTLEKVLLQSSGSCLEGYNELCIMYEIFNGVNEQTFSLFIDPSNHVAQILLCHFFLIEQHVGLLALQAVVECFPFRGIIVASWVRKVAAALPPGYRDPYMAWPLSLLPAIDRWELPARTARQQLLLDGGALSPPTSAMSSTASVASPPVLLGTLDPLV